MTDCISRSMAKKHLLKEYPLLQKERLEQTIASIPAADVRENVRGEWTCHRTLEHDGDWWCTACGAEITIYMGEDRPDRYRFCPNCGADMRP